MASLSHWGRRVQMLLPALVAIGATPLAAAASAQDQQGGSQPTYSTDPDTTFQAAPAGENDTGERKVGIVATSAVGTAGQRLQPDQGIANTRPMARLDTRIANRVQSRIRNRIDRYYDPEANATSPFKIAADQTRTNTVVPH